MRPALSIVLFGRNDNYGNDYAYRLNTSLNHLGLAAERTGVLDDLEIIFVDWGSETPLSSILELSENIGKITKIVSVTPQQVKRLSPSAAMYSTLAVNVGARRAAGQYIMTADTDSLYPDAALETLVRLSKGNLPLPVDPADTLFPIRRYQIPYNRVSRQPTVHEWDRVLPMLTAGQRTEAPGQSALGGFAAALLMHRDMWDRVGGYNELLIKPWGWNDNDMMIRAMIRHQWFDLAHTGVFAFHMEHAPRNIDPSAEMQKLVNPMLISVEENPSGPDWGAGREPMEIIAAASKPPRDHGEKSYLIPFSDAFESQKTFDQLGSEPPDAEGCHVIFRDLNFGPGLSDAEREASLLLYSFCRRERPQTLFHVGTVCPTELAAIFSNCKTIEAVMYAPWPPGDSTPLMFSPMHYGILASLTGYQGYGRLVPQTRGDAEKQVADLIAKMPQIELAVFDRRTFADPEGKVLARVASSLAPGGLLVVIDNIEREQPEPKAWGTFDRMSMFFGSAAPTSTPAEGIIDEIVKSARQLNLPPALNQHLRAYTTASDFVTAVVAVKGNRNN